MIVFVNHDGSIALQSVSTINQGSVDANKITIVHPFSTAIVRLAFTLPNGIVLEEPKLASDSTSIPIDEYKGLSVSEYTFDRELTRVSGTLGVQIFFTYIDPTDKAEKRTVTIATPLINIPIYNGSRVILDNAVEDGTPLGDIMAIASAAKGSAADARLDAATAVSTANTANTNSINAKTTAQNAYDRATSASNATYALSQNTVKLTPSDTTVTQTIYSDLKVTKNLNVDGTIEANGIKAHGNITADSGTQTTLGALEVRNTASAHSISTNSIESYLLQVLPNSDEDQLIEMYVEGNNLIVSEGISVGSIRVNADGNDPANITKTGDYLNIDSDVSIGANLEVNSDVSIGANLAVNGNVNVGNTLNVTGNLDVGGNLNLKGTPITQNMETLLVKDNIIVTNSSGAGFSLSGIVMRTSPPDPINPNSPTKAYGILYDTINEAVMIGEGVLKEITDATTGAVTCEFNYYVGKSLPLAARSGFNNIKDGYIPVWDADLYAFVPSDKTAESLATQTWVETYVADYVANNGGGGGDTAEIAELLHKINTGGIEE